jgi:hypothetical protein
MAKAEKPNPKPKKKTDKDQAERFIETARQIGVDETGARFERAFQKIVQTARKPSKAL